jgi:hypothetical protein
LSDIIDFSTKAKLRLTPDNYAKDVVLMLQRLLVDAQEGKIIGFAGGLWRSDGMTAQCMAGAASENGVVAVGLLTHAANIVSGIMLRSAE